MYLVVTVTKTYDRINKGPYVLLQIRLTPEELRKLRVLAAELGITAQEFIKRLLRGVNPNE